jgi:hypothetical protein
VPDVLTAFPALIPIGIPAAQGVRAVDVRIVVP